MPQNLYKSRNNRVIAGVCGGVAEYFNVDATLVRLAWALTFFLGGGGLILYILAVIIMPEGPGEQSQPSPAPSPAESDGEGPAVPPPFTAPQAEENKRGGEEKRRQLLGLILIAVGGYFLLERFFPAIDFDNWWPLLLIILGVFIIAKK